MALVTFIFLILSILILFLKYREIINPVILVFFYFFGMLFLYNASVLGLEPKSDIGTVAFIVAFSSALIGAVLASKNKRIPADATLLRNTRFMSLLFIVVCLIPISFVGFKSILFMLANGYD